MDYTSVPDVVSARRLIEEIWKENTTITAPLQRLLESALTTLSGGIYEKQTHFLLELIQNAEDNTYGDETPSLSFTYKPGSLRVDCNEIGFTERNVRAICSLGGSTKAGPGQSARYVGEKGIGFKSVFKVASEVYISSRSFSFKFDGSQGLGRIAPIWSEFPEPIQPRLTSFYLKLSENTDEGMIAHDIQRLDPTLLLFLRRLREINLKATLMDGSTWSQTLRRQDPLTQDSHITQLHRGPSISDYIVVKHLVHNLPEEQSRVGVTESEISLAFPPLHETSEDHTHAVYAFLPIRDYGFKFLLQGDFVLTANREDVPDNPWNRALRAACADAFVRAIHHLNLGPRRYDWISYIPGRHILGFFEPLRDMILDKLSQEPILEACSRKMVAPARLTYVPPSRFTDDDGLPLTLSPNTKDLYLSCSYPQLKDTMLSSLGTLTLDGEGFLQHLSLMIVKTTELFRQKPREWHEKLANALIALYEEDGHRDCIKGLEIIPLSNSEWVSADTGPIHFSEETQQLRIPETIPMRTVSTSIKESPSQINLFLHLGVKPQLDGADVCLRITELHGDVSFKPGSLTHAQLVEHIAFMFKASFHPLEAIDLWFATTDNQRVKGSSAYICGQCEPGSFKDRIRRHVETNYPVLHNAYTHSLSSKLEKAKWTRWAQQCFHIQPSTFPRISTGAPQGNRAGTLRLSSEFESLFRDCQSSDVLELLRVRWRDYSQIVEEVFIIDGKALGNPVKDSIMEMKVRCCTKGKSKDHCFRRFGETILPSLDRIVDGESCIPFLDVPGPSKQWGFLRTFQVSVHRDIEYYVRCLLAIESSTKKPLRKTVVHIYERIQADYMENEKEIRKNFMQKPLIYTSLCSSGSDPETCWMSGKECLEKNLDIAIEYDSSATLFRNLLGTGRNDIERQLRSLRAITEETSLGDILAFFVKIDRLIQAQGSQWFKTAAEELHKWPPVFPILKTKSDNEYDALAPLNPPFRSWFIADREHLRDSFSGCVDILAISPREIESIQAFLEALDLQPRILSTIVKVESQALGKPKLHKAYTNSLRLRAAFITALIPKQQKNRDALVKEILRVEVNIAAGIVQEYTFQYGGRQFSGANGLGEVALSERDGRLQVFMTRENISATVPPPELGNEICGRYGIVNPAYRNLVHFALGENSPQRLSNAFTREGIHVPHSHSGESDNEFAALSRDEFLDTSLTDEEDETQDAPKDKFDSKFKHIPASFLDGIDEEDRRLPLQYFKWSERILFRSISCDPGTDYRTVLRQEPAHGQYAAEVLNGANNQTSTFLQQELGSLFKPDDHWTSPQRYKAGYRRYPHPVASCAAFTIADREASRKFSGVLSQRGFEEANTWAWTNSDPTYHLDMAVSSGEATSDFAWTSQQFERMRAFRTDKQQKASWKLKDVHILVRISNIFTSPTLDLFVDSWRLFSSERFALHGNWTFAATILDPSMGSNCDPPSAGDQQPPAQLSPSPSTSLAASQSLGQHGDSSRQSLGTGSCNTPISLVGSDSPYLPPHSRLSPQSPHEPMPVHGWSPQQNWQGGNQEASHWLGPWHAGMSYPQVLAVHPVHPASPGPRYQPQNHQLLAVPGQVVPGRSLRGSASDYRSWSTSSYRPPSPAGHVSPSIGHFLPTTPQQSPDPTHSPSATPISIDFPKSDSSSVTEFSYKPLNKDDIRLLVLHPGQEDCQLRAVVYRCPLLAANSFQAVSYTWGSSELSHSLWTPEGTIKLGASLHATLRCIRHEKQPVLLWADGICINQSDQDEKSKQIRLLPQVFQRATCVLACLGSDSKGDRAMEALMQIRVHDALPEEWPKDLARMPEAWRKRGLPPPDDPIWAEIGALFERPWFERAWIIQELLVATSVRVICGKWMIDWNDLLTVIRVISRASPPLPEQAQGKAQGKFSRFSKLAKCREGEAKHERRPLLDLLEDFRDSKSSIDHDRFFCLLGLANDGNNTGFIVDYSLSFDAIVRKYAWAFIEQGKVLELLHRAGINSRKKDSFPSWIPDWTVPKPRSLRTLEVQGMPYAASKRLSPRLDTGPMNDLELRLHGFRVDEIESISETSNITEKMGLYMDEIDRMIASSPNHREGDLKWKVPIAGAWRCRSDGHSMKSSYLALRECLAMDRDNSEENKAWTKVKRKAKSTSGKDPNHIAESRDSLWARGQDYYLTLQGNLTGWKFVVTKQRRVGVVPPTAKKGDVVSVIHGGVVPFLLRKEKAFRGSFSLVGECYIHGLMNNEAETLYAASEQVIYLR